jgi:hypothetical protein
MNNKRQVIDTDFNQKMNRDHFIHVELAPAVTIPESVLQSTIIEMSTRDGSHPPILVQLVDLARFPLYQLSNYSNRVGLDSHGMKNQDLQGWLLAKYPSIGPTHEIAVYYYQKIKQPA